MFNDADNANDASMIYDADDADNANDADNHHKLSILGHRNRFIMWRCAIG